MKLHDIKTGYLMLNHMLYKGDRVKKIEHVSKTMIITEDNKRFNRNECGTIDFNDSKIIDEVI